MRSIVSTLVSCVCSNPTNGAPYLTVVVHLQLKIYDTPNHLVIVVGAEEEEELSFTEEVGMRMKLFTHENTRAQR